MSAGFPQHLRFQAASFFRGSFFRGSAFRGSAFRGSASWIRLRISLLWGVARRSARRCNNPLTPPAGGDCDAPASMARRCSSSSSIPGATLFFVIIVIRCRVSGMRTRVGGLGKTRVGGAGHPSLRPLLIRLQGVTGFPGEYGGDIPGPGLRSVGTGVGDSNPWVLNPMGANAADGWRR
jgi:hypothetical protein